MSHAIAIAFSAYPVTDLARARAFYEDLLGLTPACVLDLPDGQWLEYELGPHTLALARLPGWQPGPDGGVVALEVADFDATVAALKAAGVKFRTEPFATPVCRMAMVLDPDGNTLCLHQRHASA